ncbi:hypothetical protein [Verminephrobacter aporrectodeae]|uniref:hypothetical protein n=1 Tax=Verminephrobacter aporrectodeae TaxID=1110389 RepID=UPI0022441ED7|nr:hypothetical protein [Verminephrobacter aporrectodeae]MCW8177493.1 hypothetical protein [Verminephrobacter aporrectodeae subsp. tuberculatae]MCW8203256.1 hypothetical protein [Verminephrobacter aporrectodeae subsp. tuberculatae]
MAAPRTRFLFWLLACGLTLTACNEGGDPVDVGHDAINGDLFITPAGVLCLQREMGGNCVQPTSSSTNELALHKAITDPDPDAPMINFDSSGYIIESPLTKGIQGSIDLTYSYGLARRHVQAGRNSFIVDGRRYGNANHLRDTDIYYTREQGGGAYFTFNEEMGHNPAWDFSFVEGEGVTNKGGAGWYAKLGLLTDQTDAPRTRKVTYVGVYYSVSGTAKPIDKHSDLLNIGVTYEAELDLHTGSLSGVSIDYTDPKAQRHTRLKLPDLTFKHSRLYGLSKTQRIDIEIDGPVDDWRSGGPHPDTPRVQHDFTIEGLEGEILGKQAALIHLIGGGPKGVFQIMLYRKELFELMDNPVINFPLTPAKP